jgi:alkylation response protein AidB-like acyl-CoA dehydrogenase
VKDFIDEDQEELRQALRRFFVEKSPEVEVRRLMETPEGFDPRVWKQMADQVRVQGLSIPEEYGGMGFGCTEQLIAMEEMGRVLLCAPYFSSIILAPDCCPPSWPGAPRNRSDALSLRRRGGTRFGVCSFPSPAPARISPPSRPEWSKTATSGS